MAIRDHYQRVIKEIMRDRDVSVAQSPPGHTIPSNATLVQVLRYSEFYIGGGRELRWQGGQGDPHYRYARYRGALTRFGLPTIDARHRLAHVDIGCGAGLFAWALLDWASGRGVRYTDINLYGYDYSKEMVRLAQMMRTRLAKHAVGYPMPRLSANPKRLLGRLAHDHHNGTIYLITFGYVLAGNHYGSDISSFAQIVGAICEISGRRGKCFLLASDSTRGDDFTYGWNKLMAALRDISIVSEATSTSTGERGVLLSRK